MRKIILLLMALPMGLQAQIGHGILETTGGRFNIPTNGMLFHTVAGPAPGFETPAGSDLHTLFNSALWIGGVTEMSDLRMAATMYCENGANESGFCEFYPGPLKVETGTTTYETMDVFNRIWTVSGAEVGAHIAYFDCINDPECDESIEFPDGYQIPEAFLTWPAHGDVAEGFAENIAPFVDVDEDGIYNSEVGDYPEFCGDYAAFLITNDNGGLHFETYAEPIRVEIQTMIYAYDDEGPLGNSVYVRQKLINRGAFDLIDTYVGIWSDFDIGNYADDFVGTDVQRGMIYGYNGAASDAQFGSDLPMLGLRVLKGPLADANDADDAMPYDGYDSYGRYLSGWGDGIVDNETIGLNSAMNLLNTGDVNMSTPQTAAEFYNNLSGKWRSGVPMVHGGSGFGPDSELLETRYMFPGDTDPEHDGTGGLEPEEGPQGWTEITAEHSAHDRRTIGAMGPFTFESGSEETIEYAYVFARQSMDPEANLLALLQQNADLIEEEQCYMEGDITTDVAELESLEFSLFPNPSKGAFTLKTLESETGIFRVFNIVGQELANGVLQFPETRIQLDGVTNGMYFVKVQVGERTSTKKVIVKN